MADVTEKSLKWLLMGLYSPTASRGPSLYQMFPVASMATMCECAVVPIVCSLRVMVPLVVGVKLPNIVLPFSPNQTLFFPLSYTIPYGSLLAVGRVVSMAVC